MLLNISCCIRISTAAECIQFFICSCGSLFTLKSIPTPYVSFFFWSCQLLKIKICSPNSFTWIKEVFAHSKCQTSQHIRHASEALSIALGRTSSFNSENWKLDSGGTFNICSSWWSTGSDGDCIEIILIVLACFWTTIFMSGTFSRECSEVWHQVRMLEIGMQFCFFPSFVILVT